ncbi:MAG TPA: Fe-S cluster assembly protein SufD [Pyrinomonadaceae bacterium]|nr:Fe-S cluster assembly protein SufD [Pyrinomonadaceae bacterium]
MSSQLVKQSSSYDTAFRALREKTGNAEPSWLRRMREDSFAHFERVGFPSVKEEEWKYTNVAPIAKLQFAPAFPNGQRGGNGFGSFVYDEARQSRLVFCNGILQRELSSVEALPAGVQVIEISEALVGGQNEISLRESLERAGESGFTALNTALFSSGAFVFIPAGVSVASPIHLQFTSDSSNGAAAATFPRVLVVAEENSSATIIESYASPRDGVYLTNAIVDVRLGAGAHLQHFRVQRESTNAFHVATTNADLGPNANYDATSINLGAALSRHTIDVTMDHEGAECHVDGLYMVGGSQHTDTHSMIDHRQPHCTSQQLYKGILDGKSRAVFNGKVFVRHGAQQTNAQQTNKNLLLSNEAQVDTKPQLEIFADDVKCAHGAAIGQLKEDEIFYLESRGLRPELARNVLTYGFAEEVIEKIKIASIKRELDAAVLNRLSSDLEIR